ncbi:MAG: MBL fold metallo-hydrolase, partial [Pseudomonadota bacterium]
GVNVLVVDCLRRKPHPTHAHLEMSLELIDAVRADRGILTHLDKSMDYRTLGDETPAHVEPAYDGMEIVV